ncbi:biopolymer transporter ExbD [Halosquirtibacter xylanolyticus]|uniref:ExbD/TolR family protein n=1 Tax=Halosquirtibacter xylanolyticus TaxID=3374599 RepID=UPI00374A2918|nr:biopolymer transporter ExbD [Prolixibacteraceae bacterium]
MPKKLPEYNASSLADIAFMLLIFFLVTTTMDVDSGLRRKLPPMPPKDMQIDPNNKIKDRNIFEVLVNSKDQLLVEGELMRVEDLYEATQEFMLNDANASHLPEKKMMDVPFFGETLVTKGVISLRNDIGTTYGTYIAVQNELVRAINDLRDDISKRKWNKKYEDLNTDQQKAIRKLMPQKISEAEPKKVGGN